MSVTSEKRRGRRRVPARGPGSVPVWLFDLDNTLHHASHAIFPAINRGMTQYIIEKLGVDSAEASRLRTGYTQRYGATLLGLIRHHQIDPAEFLRVVHTFTDLASMVRAERGLARMLRGLPGRKLVLTNGPSVYARAVLAELGIARMFERVIAIEDMQVRGDWRAKPDAAMLRRAMHRANVRLADAILVEDTRGHLKRYKRLGLRTVWITGHLPTVVASSDSGFMRATSHGRPHYVDLKIRTLKGLRGARW